MGIYKDSVRHRQNYWLKNGLLESEKAYQVGINQDSVRHRHYHQLKSCMLESKRERQNTYKHTESDTETHKERHWHMQTSS